MEISLAIIGTAFRKEDNNHCSKPMFDAMHLVAGRLLDTLEETNYKITHLVSGGNTGAEHIAVKLYLENKVPNLRLFLTSGWNDGNFKDTGIVDWKKNPGAALNIYHRKFQVTTGINSLSDIQVASFKGAELIEVSKGYYARNSLVAKSDCVLAMTFGNKHFVKEGTTVDIIQRYLERVKKGEIFDKSFHYDLLNGEIYIGCKVEKYIKELQLT